MAKKLHAFSVIIPAFNEEDYIADCVKSLKLQNYGGKFEIIVVDNASTDNTATVAKKNGAKVVREEKKGVSAARRKGCSEATGEIFALTDADSKVPPDWLIRLNDIFNSDKNIIAAGGLFRFDEVSFTVGLLANKFFLPLNSLILKYFITPRSPFLTGSNMAIRREIYEKSGGFDPELVYAEDNDMAQKASRFGKVYFDSKLKVKTSFRRYSGGHSSLIFVLPRALKETFATISRFLTLKSRNKTFSAQSAVREKPPGSLKRPPQKNHKAVALTFDDGPYGNATNRILDILKEKNIKATFFLLGKNVEKYPEVVQREIREGHIIGNHSNDHSKVLFLKSRKGIRENVLKAKNSIEKASGLRPRFFRPPYGLRSPWMKKFLVSQKYILVPLDIMTKDYNVKTKPKKITRYILHRIKPGSIITLHDGRDNKVNYSRENLIEALPDIIDGIRKAGYTIVPLDQLTGEEAYFKIP